MFADQESVAMNICLSAQKAPGPTPISCKQNISYSPLGYHGYEEPLSSLGDSNVTTSLDAYSFARSVLLALRFLGQTF